MSRGGWIEEREREKKINFIDKIWGEKRGESVRSRMEITGGGDVNDVMQISAFFSFIFHEFFSPFLVLVWSVEQNHLLFYAVRIEAREMKACVLLPCM